MTFILKYEDRIVTVQNFEDGPKMVAIDAPNVCKNDNVVLISKRQRGNGKQMTLCFKRQQRYYRPMVAEEGLKVEPCSNTSQDNPDNKYWFFMETHARDNTYSLRAVHKPSHYLTVDCNGPYAFYLNDNVQDSAQVTEIPNTS